MYQPDYRIGPPVELTKAQNDAAKLDAEWNEAAVKPERLAEQKRLDASDADKISKEWAQVGARPTFGGRNGDAQRERARDESGKFKSDEQDDAWEQGQPREKRARLSGVGGRVNWSPGRG